MKYFSTFSGIGGFELGIEQAYELQQMGIESEDSTDSEGTTSQHAERPLCIGYSEIDKYASAIYQKHFRQPRTKEEIENDLDVVKTIVSENNYDIMDGCYVNTAKKEMSFIKTTNQNVKTASEGTNLDGVKIILKKAGQQGENIMLCEDSECSICMGEDVFVAENLKKCSLPLNIKTEMDTLKESNMELAICINSPLKNIDQTDTKSCATTVITLKEDTLYAHIKKTKPHRNFGDITKINADELPDFDILVGGFPCQAFSIAGKRKGFDDTRGTLFFDLARILRAKQPRLFVFENVKGLLSHDSGKTFSTIISTITELGYDCQWQVVNSKNHGVPQNRERVLIVGHLRGTPRPQVFPFGTDDYKTINIQGHSANTLTARYYGAETTGTYIEESKLDAQVRETVDGFHSFRNDKKKSSIQGTHVTYKTGKSHALNTAHIPMTLENAKIRRLTPTECERLQGFPDGWTEGVSDTQRYKTLGNAVTVNVICDVMEKLLNQTPT